MAHPYLLFSSRVCVCVCEGPEAAEPVSGVWATAGWESLCHDGAAERKYSAEEAAEGKVRKENDKWQKKRLLHATVAQEPEHSSTDLRIDGSISGLCGLHVENTGVAPCVPASATGARMCVVEWVTCVAKHFEWSVMLERCLIKIAHLPIYFKMNEILQGSK